MSPSTAVSLLEPVTLDERTDKSPLIRLVSGLSVEAAQAVSERRAYQRLRDHELEWIRHARLSAGKGVSLVDLSAGGALLDSPVPLRPDSLLTLEIIGQGLEMSVQFRVLRCEVGAIGPAGPTYRGACKFTRLIELPGVRPPAAPEPSPGAFVGLDFALKQLVERVGPASDSGSLDPDCILHALRALQLRALRQPLDPIGSPLGGLLAHVVPALEHEAGLPAIVHGIELQLRLTVPQANVRLTSTGDSPAPGMRSILINVPGAAESSALVSIDIPRGVVLNDWQSRVLRLTSRVLALLQRLEPERAEMCPAGAVDPSPSSRDDRSPASQLAASAQVSGPLPSTTDDSPQAMAWQKIVVRYVEGQMLKGYTQDFSASRSQFSLWPSINAAADTRVIVPLARLKGVF
ncbi:MAG: PilZ domain-containing protein, partial [Acidobacteriota bacterium]|nr:PilZ domain-containing protein [Acidobacteriota bacterium]